MSEIYEPREDSQLLAEVVKKYAKGRVLDMGTGSGIQAVTAAKKKSVRSVLAVDKNPDAVKTVKGLGVKKITVTKSDLFKKVKGKFDTILFNPPYLPQDPGVKDDALYGGKQGYETIVRFLDQVDEYLAPKGEILLLFSSFSNKEKVMEAIEHNLLYGVEVGKTHVFMEDLWVYRIRRTNLHEELRKKGVNGLHYPCISINRFQIHSQSIICRHSVNTQLFLWHYKPCLDP
jgi:release factor glutamine methyltransferase